MKKHLIFGFMLAVGVTFGSCSSDKDDVRPEPAEVVIKAIGSSNVKLSTVVITNNGESFTKTDLSGSSFTSATYSAMGNGSFGAGINGTTTDGKTGTLKLQILKGDQVLKESSSEGDILTVSLTY